MSETPEYYRGAIAALEEIYNGPNVLRSAARVTIVAMLESYRLKLRALTPPAIASGDVAIGAEAEGLTVTGWPTLPDETMQFIFGIMPWTSASYARLLRANGVDVPRKCEMEQAYTIHWMLGHYLKHGPDKWREFAGEEVKSALALIAQAKEAGR